MSQEKRLLRESLLNTSKVIFRIPSDTQIFKQNKQINRFIREARLIYNRPDYIRALREQVILFNKNIQAEWFKGPTFRSPEVPVEYQLRFKELERTVMVMIR